MNNDFVELNPDGSINHAQASVTYTFKYEWIKNEIVRDLTEKEWKAVVEIFKEYGEEWEESVFEYLEDKDLLKNR